VKDADEPQARRVAEEEESTSGLIEHRIRHDTHRSSA